MGWLYVPARLSHVLLLLSLTCWRVCDVASGQPRTHAAPFLLPLPACLLPAALFLAAAGGSPSFVAALLLWVPFRAGVVTLYLVTHGSFSSHWMSHPSIACVKSPSTLLLGSQQLHTVFVLYSPLFLYACDICSFSDSQQPVCRAFCGLCVCVFVGRRHVPIYIHAGYCPRVLLLAPTDGF